MMTCNTRKENTNVVSATKPSNPLYLSYCLAKRESKLEMEENNFIFKGLPCSIGCQWFSLSLYDLEFASLPLEVGHSWLDLGHKDFP